MPRGSATSTATRNLEPEPEQPQPSPTSGPGSEQSALLGSLASDFAQQRACPENISAPQLISGIRNAQNSSGDPEQKQPVGVSCSAWCGQLLDRVCGRRDEVGISGTPATITDITSGTSGDIGNTSSLRNIGNNCQDAGADMRGDPHDVGPIIAGTQSSTTAGDLFADFEAKAKLFEQLAADTSVEVSFVAQEEQEEENGRLITPDRRLRDLV